MKACVLAKALCWSTAEAAGLTAVFVCSARRVQNMGWTPTNTLWLATRGGDVYFGSDTGAVGQFDQAKLGSRGFGILDVGCGPAPVFLMWL